MAAPGAERAVRRRYISDPRPRSAAWCWADEPLQVRVSSAEPSSARRECRTRPSPRPAQGAGELLSCRPKRLHPVRPASRRGSLDSGGARRQARRARATCPLQPQYALGSLAPPPPPATAVPQQQPCEPEQVPSTAASSARLLAVLAGPGRCSRPACCWPGAGAPRAAGARPVAGLQRRGRRVRQALAAPWPASCVGGGHALCRSPRGLAGCGPRLWHSGVAG